jgi:hypothetical protein
MPQSGNTPGVSATGTRLPISARMRPIKLHWLLAHCTHRSRRQGPESRNTRSGCGPIERRISSVNAMGGEMGATSPLPLMKPMIFTC